jgi:mannose-1-phosphate guanylyltransferase
MAHLIDRPDDDVMVVLPADQAVRDEDGFRAGLAAAAERAASGEYVTLGVEPTGPSTGYGYVIATGPAQAHGGRDTFRVERFEEKPDPGRARELIATGTAYWNAGIFVWQRSALVAGLARHAADISGPLRERVSGLAPGDAAGWPGETIAGTYADLRATSIDYALLEPASLEAQVAVVPVAVGWSDLGSWSALHEQRAVGAEPVISTEGSARVIDIGGRGLLVHAAGGRTVATVGLDGVIVVDTPDALLVISSEAAQDVKQVVSQLQEEESELL